MITRLLISFSLVLCCFPFLNAQWDGREDMDITINKQPNKTFTTTVTVQAPLLVSGDTLDVSCAEANIIELTAVDLGSALKLTLCGTSNDYSYIGGKVFISNSLGNRLNFIQEATPDFDFPFPIDSTVLNVYYDALVLELGSAAQKAIIFNKYQLNKRATPHKFLASVQPEIALVESSREDSPTPSFNSSNASGINITKIADGFAKFIASQFKKELTISFFNKFTSVINRPDTRDLQVLFKNTHSELNLIGDRFTHYQAYISSLRQTMEYDCHELPERFKTILDDPNSQISAAMANEPDVQYVLENVLTLGLELSDSVHLGKALADLDLSKNIGLGVVDQNLKGSFETVQLMSESLRNIKNGPNDSYWIAPAQMTQLVQDTTLLNYYLGLLAEKSRIDSISLTKGSLYDLLSNTTTKEATELVESMISSIRSVEQILHSSQGGIEENNKDIIALQYFDAATNLLNTSDHLEPFLSPEESQHLHKFNMLASNINDMTRSFITQKYSMGLLHLSRILTEVSDSSKTMQKLNDVITNEGLFVAQMAESDNSDDVAAILESFAAPIGSWRDKRTAKWNIALDSYIGPAVYKIQDNKARFAFSTPVGASVTIPFNHVTFFVSIADLGPITSFRLVNDTSEIANLYLKEILSPGVFASINFGDNYPVTINAGYQQFPLLEKVNEVENTVNVNRKGGFSGSIVVNVPLFTLYNQRKD